MGLPPFPSETPLVGLPGAVTTFTLTLLDSYPFTILDSFLPLFLFPFNASHVSYHKHKNQKLQPPSDITMYFLIHVTQQFRVL